MSQPPEDTSTAFSILPTKFPNPSERVETETFLQASEGLTFLIERFGKVFSPVVYDMRGNIGKLRKKYNSDCESGRYLEDMILKEQEETSLVATDALQWLRRGLHFMGYFFAAIIEDSTNEIVAQDLSSFIEKAYSETLERYHGWLGTQLFHVLTKFVPNRQQLFCNLALQKKNFELHVIRDMKSYNENLMACVNWLIDFYTTFELETLNNV